MGRLLLGALGVALAMAGAASPEESRPREEDMEPGLLRVIRSLRRGFSTGTAEPILLFVPSDSKVYISAGSIAAEPSFYSRDQVGALLRRAFESHKTVQFTVLLERMNGVEEGSEMILCPAAWVYESHGTRSKVNLRFILSRRPAAWTLKEIRETL
jgi:hypothetical protein